jgi:hypothetical protein
LAERATHELTTITAVLSTKTKLKFNAEPGNKIVLIAPAIPTAMPRKIEGMNLDKEIPLFLSLPYVFDGDAFPSLDFHVAEFA